MRTFPLPLCSSLGSCERTDGFSNAWEQSASTGFNARFSTAAIALLHPAVISRRTINRRDLRAHGSEIRTQLPTMMDRVEHNVPKKFHRWSFHYDLSLIKKLCVPL